jgi:alpha-beta hydrolase superfamily lysophospholipase
VTRAALLTAALCVALGACAPGGPRDTPQPGSNIVDLALPAGGVERLWYRQPERPAAVVVLFAGGDGVLALESSGRFARLGGNFLLRMRETWLRHGFAVAIPDQPTDGSRMGAGDPAVLRAVTAHVRTQTDAPIWLVGTSMGSVRAAWGAARLRADEIAGLVLTSSVSRPGGRLSTETVFSADLDRVVVPTLVVSHRGDRCFVTPPSDANEIRRALTRAPRTEVIMIEGGAPPQSDACEAYAEHGFLGIEVQVVDRIAAWIKGA